METTIAKPKAFQVLRPLKGKSRSTVAWRTLGTGIADLHRRAQVSQQANDRVRALSIGDPNELALLAAVARGEFAAAGFRNPDLRGLLYSDSSPNHRVHSRPALADNCASCARTDSSVKYPAATAINSPTTKWLLIDAIIVR